ncbi:MAG: Aspartate aminotransferase [Candidatus Heimdallarchaeota archaeon LC_2]|nr:MAG: Aspartate aminotransferase [Candidatus Heimdallarchaeota archaeon LC_2]
MDFSHYLQKVQGSATAQIFAKATSMAKQGKDVIHLEIGQPDFLPLDDILQATSRAVLEGKTQYTISRGIESLRKEISLYHKSMNGVDVDENREIIITSGGKLGLFGSLWALLDIGDNVIVLNPSWVSYNDIILSLGGEPRFIPVDANFGFDEELIRDSIDPKTKAIIVNSPSNPTGALISQKNLQVLYDIASENNITLISEEMYSEFVYGSDKHHSLLEIKNWQDHGIVNQSLSKTFSMTGFRIGYVMSQESLISEINKVNQLTSSCATKFAQYGAIEAFKKIDLMRKKINELMPRRRDLMTKLLSELPVDYFPPKGAIYGWIGIPTMSNSIKWCEELLTSVGVATTPGRAFGPDGEGYLRISFAVKDDMLEEGITRIGKFLSRN